jgi:hypothetical protein
MRRYEHWFELEESHRGNYRPDAPDHGSQLQSASQSPRSGNDAGRAVGREGVADKGDVVTQDRAKRSVRDWAGRNQAVSPFFFEFNTYASRRHRLWARL